MYVVRGLVDGKRSASDVIPDKNPPQQPDERRGVPEKPTVPERRPKKEPARPKTTLSDLRNDPMRSNFAHIADSDEDAKASRKNAKHHPPATFKKGVPGGKTTI